MGRRKRIGVITPGIHNGYQKKLLMGIQKQAYEDNYDVLVFSTFSIGKLWYTYHTGAMNIF